MLSPAYFYFLTFLLKVTFFDPFVLCDCPCYFRWIVQVNLESTSRLDLATQLSSPYIRKIVIASCLLTLDLYTFGRKVCLRANCASARRIAFWTISCPRWFLCSSSTLAGLTTAVDFVFLQCIQTTPCEYTDRRWAALRAVRLVKEPTVEGNSLLVGN